MTPEQIAEYNAETDRQADECNDNEPPPLIQLSGGRWMLATWNERQNQWQSGDLRKSARTPGYCYSYAGSPESLARIGIRTYASRAAAVRAWNREVES